MATKKSTGHPAKQDPDISKLYKAMRSSIELVRDLEHRVDEETFVSLRAAALGLMITYSELTGLPSPLDIFE